METMKLTAEDIVRVGEKYYFVALEINALCELGSDNKINVVGNIPDEDVYTRRVCSKLLTYANQLFLLPMNGRKIWVYDLKMSSWESIEIDNSVVTEMKFMQGIVYKGKLILIGCYYPAIVLVDLNTRDVSYIKRPYIELSALHREKCTNYFRCDCAVNSGKLYLASCLCNKVLVFDLESLEWDYFTVGNEGRLFSGITWDGEYYWISPKTDNVLVRWDGKDEYEEYVIEDEKCGNNFRFTGIIKTSEGLMMPAKDGKYTYFIPNSDVTHITKEQQSFLFCRYEEADDSILAGTKDGRFLLLKSGSISKEVIFRVDLHQLKEKLHINSALFDKYFDSSNIIAIEDQYLTLDKFLIYLCDGGKNGRYK